MYQVASTTMGRNTSKPVIDFTSYITERTENFTGREWVFLKLKRWLEADGPRIFLLTGEPGSGKTALAARLVQMSQGQVLSHDFPRLGLSDLAYTHFCRAIVKDTLSLLQFVQGLSLGLARRYPAFARAILGGIEIEVRQTVTANYGSITGVRINSIDMGNLPAREAFDRWVRKPLEQVCTSNFTETILILVDALDETLAYDPNENIVTLLAHATNLPPQARLLLTSRPDPRVLSSISASSLDLIEDSPIGVDDVREYVCRQLHMLAKPERRKQAEKISTTAQGSFVYARLAINDLLSYSPTYKCAYPAAW